MLRRPLLRCPLAPSALPLLMVRSGGPRMAAPLTSTAIRAFHTTPTALCSGVEGAHHGVSRTTPLEPHPGMENEDAWRGPLTGKPLSDVFTKDTQTWSSSLCFGGLDDGEGGSGGAGPTVVDAATGQRIADVAALLERRTAAGFGRSDAPEATFRDDAVRRTSVASGVVVEWPGLAAAAEKVRAALYPGEGPLTATLHNVLVYEAGDHFDWHRDMPKVPGHLATLSVECDVAGARPATGPDAAAVVFAEEGVDAGDCRVYAPRGAGDWAAWPIATRHRAVAVPAGASRVTAIFNLARTVGPGETPLADAVAAVPATHRPAMAAVGEWMAQQRPLLWTEDKSLQHGDEHYDAYDTYTSDLHRGVEPPTKGVGEDSRTAIGLLLEDVIGTSISKADESLSEAEEAQAKQEGWSGLMRTMVLNQKKMKAATASLQGKWRDLTQRDRLLYFAAVDRFGEKNVFLHQARHSTYYGSFGPPMTMPVFADMKKAGDESVVVRRPFDNVFVIGTTAVVERLRPPTPHGTVGNCGAEVELVYDRTVLCVTLRRPAQ